MKKLGLRAIFRYFFRSSFPSNRQSASFHSSLIGAARPAVISNPTMTVWQTPFICPVSVLTICCNNGNNISCISTHASASTPLQRHRPAGACKQLGIFLFLRLGESPLFRDRESPEYRLEESRCRCRQRQCRFPIAHLPG